MVKFKPFQSFALVLLAGALIGAAADRAISRMDVQAMSKTEKNRQIRRDLLSLLLPSQSLYRSNSLSLQGDAWLQTRASATPFKSLCQRDTLSVHYTAIDRAGRYQDRRALPYKAETTRSYRFVGPPKPEYLKAAQADDYERSPLDPECRGADTGNEWTGWLTANSPEQAMTGGFAMLALKAWAELPTSVFVSCIAQPDPRACTTGQAYAMTLNFIDGVEICKAERPGELCLVLGRFGTLFTIHARDSGQPMRAEDIRSADYEQQIIVT